MASYKRRRLDPVRPIPAGQTPRGLPPPALPKAPSPHYPPEPRARPPRGTRLPSRGAAAHSAPSRTVPRSRNGPPTDRLLAVRIDPPSCASTPASDHVARDNAALHARRATLRAAPCSLRATTRPRTHRRATPPRCAPAHRAHRCGSTRSAPRRPELRHLAARIDALRLRAALPRRAPRRASARGAPRPPELRPRASAWMRAKVLTQAGI